MNIVVASENVAHILIVVGDVTNFKRVSMMTSYSIVKDNDRWFFLSGKKISHFSAHVTFVHLLNLSRAILSVNRIMIRDLISK